MKEIIQNQQKYDICISNNLNKQITDIPTTCSIPDDDYYHCDKYFEKNDVNNNFKTKIIGGKCSSRFKNDEKNFNNMVNAYPCKSKKELNVKFYNINGDILTYNKNKSNEGWIPYTKNLYKIYNNIEQVDFNCTNLI
jgi:hypothetical protein